MRTVVYLGFLLVGLAMCSGVHAQSWTKQSDMKLKRSEAAVVDYKGELYVFNGFSRGLFVGNSIEKYNPDSKKWTLLGNTSVANGTAVTHTGTVLVGSDVWLLGGRVGAHPGRVTSEVWIYNINSKQWRKGPSLPTPMAGGGAALVNSRIHIFGGVDSQAKCDVNFHYVYNLNAPGAGWKNLTASAAMPSPRNHFSTVVLNNLIYAIGGQNGHDGCPGIAGGNVALVHAYNPANNNWQRLANLPAIESHNEPGTFVHNGFIYSVGGTTAGNKVVRYDRVKNSWAQVATLPEKLVAPVARIYNGDLVVGGGGAPRTSQSIPTVRSLTSSVFNDQLGGGQTPVFIAPEPEPVSQEQSPPQPTATDTPQLPNAAASSYNDIIVDGNQLSWPDNGWYQVLTEGDFKEVCAGGQSCEVPIGLYLVINHTSGERVRDIVVGQATQIEPDQPTDSTSPISVNGNVISWPDNGWYQVQDERDHSEVCGGGSSCRVADGVYTVINHSTQTRYEGIVVGAGNGLIEFEDKLLVYEHMVTLAAATAYSQVNELYGSGVLTADLEACVTDLYTGQANAMTAGCGVDQLLPNIAVPVSSYAYSGEGESCVAPLGGKTERHCNLESVSLFVDGLLMLYGNERQADGTIDRTVLISDDELLVSGAKSNGVSSRSCVLTVSSDDSWVLVRGSNYVVCEDYLESALSVLEPAMGSRR